MEQFITVILNGIMIGGLYGLSSSAFSFQVGALRLTNLAYGVSLMSVMYFTYYAVRVWLVPLPIAIPLVVCFYFLLGIILRRYVLGKTVAARQLLCTLGLQLIILNVTSFLTGGYPQNLSMIETRIYLTPNISFGLTQLICFIMAAVILLSFNFFLKKTWTGRAIRAVVQKKEIANLMGVNSNHMLDLAYGISYGILAIAGVMLVILFQVTPDSGNYFQTIAFVVTVSAGLGNLDGAFFSGILFGVISALVSLVFGAKYHDVIIFSFFIAILLIRPNGIFTKSSNVSREI